MAECASLNAPKRVAVMTIDRIIECLQKCKEAFGGDALVCMNELDMSLEVLKRHNNPGYNPTYTSQYQFLWE